MMAAEMTARAPCGQLHVITPEYPPQIGGVSDYTCQVASELAQRGGEVHVWCPASEGESAGVPGPLVHRQLGQASPADLRRVGRELDRFPAPRRILVQWVPHGYGCRSMNLAFCLWLWSRSARRGDRVEVMVHEPFLAFNEGSWRQKLAALVHRLMTVILLRAAERVWISIPEWERRWRPYAFGKKIPFHWLPIPSNVPRVDDAAGAAAIRNRYAPKDGLLIGHFGTYGMPVSSVLKPILLAMGEQGRKNSILLMGSGSDRFRGELLERKPECERFVHATGALASEALSSHIAACDLLLQPYPDGVSSRRTSFMAGLSHGKAMVATTGHLSEAFWETTGAVVLAPAGDTAAFVKLVDELCADPARRGRIAQAAGKLYCERFDISRTTAALSGAAASRCLTCVS
jgi:glycosyltransferase involved in cell wall biosynthesis